MQKQPNQNRQGAMPLHLLHAMLPWLVSKTISDLSMQGLPDWNPYHPLSHKKLNGLPDHLKKFLEMGYTLAADPKLANAVRNEAQQRAVEFLNGVQRYHHTPFERDVAEPPCAFSIGSARLLDYGGNGIPVFLIPSLINRYYILDLTQKLSFARFLSASGMRVFVIDWGVPGSNESHYDCGRYVTEVMAPMAQWIYTLTGRKLVLAGYCMGGLLALALAQTQPHFLAALGLLATPWDFLTPHFPRIACKNTIALERYLNASECVPAETLHMFFHSVNPYSFQSKLREFASMDMSDPATREFLAIEHWVNDGVPMARGAAHDCLIEWIQHNAPARGKWNVGGHAINPGNIHMPCFAAVPQDDKIVPSDCAMPLIRLLKNCHTVMPPSGHIGMLVGRKRRTGLWEPFAQWIKSQFP